MRRPDPSAFPTLSRRGPRWLIVLPFLLGLPLAGLAGGCRPRPEGEPHTLTVATTDNVSSLDPALAYDTWSTAVVHAMTRRLVDYDLQGNLVPDLAQKWEPSPDGKVYTFHLRPDTKFADGTPIEAKHFKAAVERVQDPKTASKGASFYAGITKLEAPAPQTLVVRLREPDPTLVNVMAMTFAAPIQEGKDPVQASASGPYMLERYEPEVQVRLARNPNDARNPSSLKTLVVQLGVEEPLQTTRFTSREVDLLPAIPPAEYARIMSDSSQRDNVARGVVNQTWYFGMNVTRAPWNNARVRQAALLAIDRERQVKIAGAGQAANGVLPPHVPGYDAGRKLPAPNIADARRLLAEAGYPNGVPDGQKSTMLLANNSQYLRHAEAIASDLRAVGIPVELRPVTLSEYLTAYKTSAACWYGGWYPDFPDAGNFMEPVFHARNIRPGASLNATRYNNPKVNALLDRAHAMQPGPAREALYREAETQVLQDLPWIPLYYEEETRYFQDGVTGVTVHPVWRQMLTGIDKKGGS